MKRALIIGASGGIGRALTEYFEAQGVHVTGLSRSADGLDLRDEPSVARVLGALKGTFDTIIVATGALNIDGAEPEKQLAAIEASAMADQFAVNAIGPALCLKYASHLLPKTGRSVFAVLTARVGSIGDNRMGGWYSYRAAKAAANQIVHTAAIEIARKRKDAIVVALHPGTVATPFTAKYAGRHPTVPPAEAASNIATVLNALSTAQTGEFFDWAGEIVPW